jgi:hypothetical protein
MILMMFALTAGLTGSKRMLSKMEIDKIIFLLILGGIVIMVSAPILWSDR